MAYRPVSISRYASP